MNADNAFKILEEVAGKDKKKAEALKNMSDADFCAKMISYLGKELNDTRKGTSYGDGTRFYTYWEIEEAFEGDVFSIEDAYLYFRALFYYEILGFCGCGSPQMILNRVIVPLLEAFIDGPYENFDINYGKNTGLSEAVVEFFLHYLDELGLTNHGSSVWGSWLEESGRMWREVLRRSKGMEI